MHPSVRLALAVALGAAATAVAAAQDRPKAPATKAQAKGRATDAAPSTSPPSPAANAKAKEVLATVNGDPITRADLVKVLLNYQNQIRPGEEPSYYRMGLDILVNGKLISQFLKQQKIAVSAEELNAEIDRQDKALRANGTSLEARLKEVGTPLEELKNEIARTLQWKKYILNRATDSELRKYFDKHKDYFDGSTVEARHVMLAVEGDASEAEKEEARQKLLSIKKEVQDGQISFADAANKYSDDHPEGESPEGGYLGVFPRLGSDYLEPFVAAAFKLKSGEISDPVETEHGYHLIQVVKRNPGRPVEFNQIVDAVRSKYMLDVQDEIVGQMRKTAKIDVKPMPEDLFAKRPPAETKKDDEAKQAPK